MVPMDREDRNRQGLQKLFLSHVPDSSAEIDPHIPKDYHHIVFADPEPFTEKTLLFQTAHEYLLLCKSCHHPF